MEEVLLQERKKRKGQLQELEALWESYRTKLQTEETERRKNAKVRYSSLSIG